MNDRKIALEITNKGGSPAATTYSEEAECDEMHRFSRKLEKIWGRAEYLRVESIPFQVKQLEKHSFILILSVFTYIKNVCFKKLNINSEFI